MTNETIFGLKQLPKSMIVIGGRPIGSEMVSALSRLGVDITLPEIADIILLREDKKLAEILMNPLKNNLILLQKNSIIISLTFTKYKPCIL